MKLADKERVDELANALRDTNRTLRMVTDEDGPDGRLREIEARATETCIRTSEGYRGLSFLGADELSALFGEIREYVAEYLRAHRIKILDELKELGVEE